MKDKDTLQWLLKNTKIYRGYILALILLQIILSGISLCYALAMKIMIDGAVVGERKSFFLGVVFFGGLILVQIGLRVLLRYLDENTKSSLENILKRRLFEALLKKDFIAVSAHHSEDWMNRLTSDTVACSSGLTDIVPGGIGMMIRLFGAVIMIIMLKPGLVFIMVLGGFLFFCITVVLRKQMKQFHKRMQEKDGKVRMYLQERISSMLVLRAFGVEKAALSGAEQTFEEHKMARMQKAVLSNICNAGFSAAMNGMELIGMGYCGYGILHGTVSYGTLTAIVQLIGHLRTPLIEVGGYIPRFYAMLASAERLLEAETYQDADTEVVKNVEEVRKFYCEEFKSLVFEQVSFDYTKETGQVPVLKKINLTLLKGDYVALCGISGCGKSTLLKLILGVYAPKEGSVYVVTKEGEQRPLQKYKRLFSYVPQGNYLFGGTIRDIISFGEERVLEGEFHDGARKGNMTVEKALELACGGFVFELPEKLETMLGEKGAGLSEGQMQRIAIARAIYADTPVLIFDEATSALDEETEQRLLRNLKQLTDKTVLLVTHRPAAFEICNKKLQFHENGTITMKPGK